MTTTAPPAPGPVGADARPPRRRWRWAVAALVLLVALVAVAVVRTGDDDPAAEGAGGARLTPGEAVTLIEPRDGAPPDLVAVVTQDERPALVPYRSLVRATFDGEVRWRRAVDPDAVPLVLTVDRGVLLTQELSDPLATALTLTEPSDLVALDSDDGSVLWRATVEAAATPQVVGDRVLVPGEDGALAALDLATGDEVWTLADPANTSTGAPTIVAMGEETVLVSRSLDDYGTELVPVAVEDGSEGPAHTPSCDGGPDGEERAFDASGVRRVSGTSDAVAVFGQLPQCVQRWDTTTGEPRWTTTTVPLSDDVGDRAPSPRAIVQDDEDLAFDGADGAVVVDLASGEHRVLEGSDVPFAVVDGTVVTVPVDDDGVRPELSGWAADGTSPEWEDVRVGVEGATTLVTSARGAAASEASALVEVEDDVLRTISLDGPEGGEVATIDPATGEVSTESVRLQPDPDDVGTTSVWTTDVVGRWAVVVVTGVPHLVDGETGEVVASWPVAGD